MSLKIILHRCFHSAPNKLRTVAFCDYDAIYMLSIYNVYTLICTYHLINCISVSLPTESSALKLKLTDRLRKADDREEVTIFRVPLSIRESNKYMFEPSVVSIGPYHRGRPHLREMEEKKLLFLRDFLRRKRCTLRDCINKIKEVENRARCCYSEPFVMSSDDFVEMMLLDGCFILEYFHKLIGTGYVTTEDLKAITEGWISNLIETDMILLENQIPYFIIETLEGEDSPLLNPKDLENIAKILTCEHIPIKVPSETQTIHHLLHLCLCYAVPIRSTEDASPEQKHLPLFNWIRTVPVLKQYLSKKQEKQKERENRMVSQIPCATELEEAGVKFKTTLEKSDDLTNITFQSGTLFIPHLLITDSVKPLFMNLIALEQCNMSLMMQRQFSTYMAFLDRLVNTPYDVKILQKNGILESMLSGEEEVALFFNQSGVNVAIPSDHYLAELFMRVNKYCDSSYHRHRARLCRDYFNNPWSVIAVIATILLLYLTIIQSFMSVYSYIRPPS